MVGQFSAGKVGQFSEGIETVFMLYDMHGKNYGSFNSYESAIRQMSFHLGIIVITNNKKIKSIKVYKEELN